MSPRIPPTTAIDSDAGRSPCCDADLVLSSPPHGYECRECTRPYDLIGDSVEAVSEEDGDGEGDASDDGEEPAATYSCGVNDCSREVDGPDDVCWQHSED